MFENLISRGLDPEGALRNFEEIARGPRGGSLTITLEDAIKILQDLNELVAGKNPNWLADYYVVRAIAMGGIYPTHPNDTAFANNQHRYNVDLRKYGWEIAHENQGSEFFQADTIYALRILE